MKSFKAIFFGSLVDIIGTVVFSTIFMFIVGVYLMITGEISTEVTEEDFIEPFMNPPLSIIGYTFGCAISILAGYITAKISKYNVYFCAGFVSCISTIFGFYIGSEYYSIAFNLFLSVLTVLSVFLGAYLWVIRNTPNNSLKDGTPEPGAP